MKIDRKKIEKKLLDNKRIVLFLVPIVLLIVMMYVNDIDLFIEFDNLMYFWGN
jgi:hypothetical protein